MGKADVISSKAVNTYGLYRVVVEGEQRECGMGYSPTPGMWMVRLNNAPDRLVGVAAYDVVRSERILSPLAV